MLFSFLHLELHVCIFYICQYKRQLGRAFIHRKRSNLPLYQVTLYRKRLQIHLFMYLFLAEIIYPKFGNNNLTKYLISKYFTKLLMNVQKAIRMVFLKLLILHCFQISSYFLNTMLSLMTCLSHRIIFSNAKVLIDFIKYQVIQQLCSSSSLYPNMKYTDTEVAIFD